MDGAEMRVQPCEPRGVDGVGGDKEVLLRR